MKKFLKSIIGKLVSFLPKKNIILFESKSDFCDNSKALFDCCIANKLNKKYKIIWFVEYPENFINVRYDNVYFMNKYHKNLKTDIIKTYYYMFAKYCFYTHSNIGINGNKNQVRYFLIHSSFPVKNTSGKYWNYKFNTYVAGTSEFSKKYRAESLCGGIDRIKITGLPRNDKLFTKDSGIFEKLNFNCYKKVILWMPTFKHINNSDRNDFGIDINNDMSILTKENLVKINKKLKKNDSMLVVKLHPAQDLNYIYKENMSNITFIDNNFLLKKNIDLYSFIGQTDAMISDFSSVYVDYLLLNKPIAFELSDKEAYEKGIGFTLSNPLDYMPGEKIYCLDDLLKFIDDLCNGIDKYKDERKKICTIFHKYKDDKSSERILRMLELI